MTLNGMKEKLTSGAILLNGEEMHREKGQRNVIDILRGRVYGLVHCGKERDETKWQRHFSLFQAPGFLFFLLSPPPPLWTLPTPPSSFVMVVVC